MPCHLNHMHKFDPERNTQNNGLRQRIWTVTAASHDLKIMPMPHSDHFLQASVRCDSQQFGKHFEQRYAL